MSRARQPVVVLQNPTAPRRLATFAQIRKEMGKVYSDAREGVIPTGDASRLIYCLGQIGSVLESEHIENRICALEKKVKTNEQSTVTTP